VTRLHYNFLSFLQKLSIPDLVSTATKHPGRRDALCLQERTVWIEAADQYAEIHCATTSYLVRLSMVSLEKQLDPEQFVRIHRSAIVHVNEVKEAVLNREKGTYLILKNGKRLKISRRRLAGVRKSSLSPTRIR